MAFKESCFNLEKRKNHKKPVGGTTMGGMFADITAPTKAELRKLVQEWTRESKAMGLEDIRLGWDSKRVGKTEDGEYKIQVWAHS